jgi:hypothetical protein
MAALPHTPCCLTSLPHLPHPYGTLPHISNTSWHPIPPIQHSSTCPPHPGTRFRHPLLTCAILAPIFTHYFNTPGHSNFLPWTICQWKCMYDLFIHCFLCFLVSFSNLSILFNWNTCTVSHSYVWLTDLYVFSIYFRLSECMYNMSIQPFWPVKCSMSSILLYKLLYMYFNFNFCFCFIYFAFGTHVQANRIIYVSIIIRYLLWDNKMSWLGRAREKSCGFYETYASCL